MLTETARHVYFLPLKPRLPSVLLIGLIWSSRIWSHSSGIIIEQTSISSHRFFMVCTKPSNNDTEILECLLFTLLHSRKFGVCQVCSSIYIKPQDFKTKMSAISQSFCLLKNIFDPSKSLMLQGCIHPLTEVTVTSPQGATCSLGEMTNHTHSYTRNAASGPV